MTKISPSSGTTSFISSKTDRAEVKPAVPYIIASFKERFTGFLTTQFAGTLMYSPNPPSVFIPKSYPVIKTSSPFMKSGTLESSTIPAASIPGV